MKLDWKNVIYRKKKEPPKGKTYELESEIAFSKLNGGKNKNKGFQLEKFSGKWKEWKENLMNPCVYNRSASCIAIWGPNPSALEATWIKHDDDLNQYLNHNTTFSTEDSLKIYNHIFTIQQFLFSSSYLFL